MQIYYIRSAEDARMVIGCRADRLGVSYGRIKRTPGQLGRGKAREIFAALGSDAVKVGLTAAEGIDGISESLDEALLGVLYRSGEIEAIKPDQVGSLRGVSEL